MSSEAVSYRVHGTTDDTDTCEVCGKIELRSVIMLAVLDVEGSETGELIYAGTTCASRMLAQRGKRITPTRVRYAVDAAANVMDRAREFADEFRAITVNGYIAANSTAYLNANGHDITRALTAARAGHAELMAEVATIDAGNLAGTRFAACCRRFEGTDHDTGDVRHR